LADFVAANFLLWQFGYGRHFDRTGARLMSTSAHIAELQRRHAVLEKKIEQLQLSPSTNPEEISGLKRKKLELKDEIEKLKASAAS
jgi:hypothetical protein